MLQFEVELAKPQSGRACRFVQWLELPRRSLECLGGFNS